jgi:RNA polymerase sigma factor (sigma-70 family)
MAPQPQSARSERAQRARILEQLLREKHSQLLRQARRNSRGAESAEDALSDACVQFMRCYDAGSGRDPLPWMLVVVKRCAWAIERSTARRESVYRVSGGEPCVEGLELVAVEERSGPAERVERSEEVTQLTALIEELKPDERTALILLGLGCSYTEIAQLRGWSLTKVNRCLSEGKAKVRKQLRRG